MTANSCLVVQCILVAVRESSDQCLEFAVLF